MTVLTRTYFDKAEDHAVPNVLSPRDLVFRPVLGTKTVQMSHLVGKPTMWFPNRYDTNRPVKLQKQARSLKFWS